MKTFKIPLHFLFEDFLENKGDRNYDNYDSPKLPHKLKVTPSFHLKKTPRFRRGFIENNERLNFGKIYLIELD